MPPHLALGHVAPSPYHALALKSPSRKVIGPSSHMLPTEAEPPHAPLKVVPSCNCGDEEVIVEGTGTGGGSSMG